MYAIRSYYEDAVFLAGEVDRQIVDRHRAGVEVDGHPPGADGRGGVPLRAADDRVQPRHQFALLEGLGEVVVGAEAEAADLAVGVVHPREDQHRRLHTRRAQLAQNVEAVHVGQAEVEDDDVVFVETANLKAILALAGGVDHHLLGAQHEFDRLRLAGVVLNQKYAHMSAPRTFNKR